MFEKTLIMCGEALIEIICVMIMAKIAVALGQPLISTLFLFFGVIVIGGELMWRFAHLRP